MNYPQTKRQELAGLEAYRLIKRHNVIGAVNTAIAHARLSWGKDSVKINLLYFNQLKEAAESLHSLNTKIDRLKEMIQVAEEEVRALHTPA